MDGELGMFKANIPQEDSEPPSLSKEGQNFQGLHLHPRFNVQELPATCPFKREMQGP
jgi:hypothetical protein